MTGQQIIFEWAALGLKGKKWYQFYDVVLKLRAYWMSYCDLFWHCECWSVGLFKIKYTFEKLFEQFTSAPCMTCDFSAKFNLFSCVLLFIHYLFYVCYVGTSACFVQIKDQYLFIQEICALTFATYHFKIMYLHLQNIYPIDTGFIDKVFCLMLFIFSLVF